MTTSWLQAFLADAVRQGFCTKIGCTTCGALAFRRGVLEAMTTATGQPPREHFDRESAVEIARALAKVAPAGHDDEALEEAVRCLLFDLVGGPLFDKDIEVLLTGTWAGDVLSGMREYDRARAAERRKREEFESQANVQKRREEKKRVRQEHHQQRLALKQEGARSALARDPREARHPLNVRLSPAPSPPARPRRVYSPPPLFIYGP